MINGEKMNKYAADYYLTHGSTIRLMEANAYREFISRQKREVMKNCGLINPEDLEAYIQHEGFKALEKVLTKTSPEEVVTLVREAGLRDRGFSGKLTGEVWAAYRRVQHLPHYVVSARLGGPGEAWIERTLLENNPFALIEGMVISAYALGGVNKGIIYIPSAYKPLAFRRLHRALEAARTRRYLGRNILTQPFSFDIEIREAINEDQLPKENNPFICGECARALFHPEEEKYENFAFAEEWPKLFYINNVETYMNIPLIISKGADWFKSLGKGKAAGTKIYALTGKTGHPCLVEAPLGSTLLDLIKMAEGEDRELLENIKAFQLGGAAGGVFPARFQNIPLDFDSLDHLGWQVGSGYIVLIDESVCVVDMTRYALSQLAAEACERCHPCAKAIRSVLAILNRLIKGFGEGGDLETLEIFAKRVQTEARCSFGRLVMNPLITSLRYFRHEYESHLQKSCPARFCKDLLPGKVKVIKLAA